MKLCIGYKLHYYGVQNGANSFWRGISASWRSINYIPFNCSTSLSFIEWNVTTSQSGKSRSDTRRQFAIVTPVTELELYLTIIILCSILPEANTLPLIDVNAN